MTRIILVIITSLVICTSTKGQNFEGQLLKYSDSTKVNYANINFFEEYEKGYYKIFSCKTNCRFKIPESTDSLLIMSGDFLNLKIINFNNSTDFVLPNIFFIEAPILMQVNFIGKKRKVNRAHKKLIKSYNKNIKNYKEIFINDNGVKYTMKPVFEKQLDSDRLKLFYVIDYTSIATN